jgi:hypothetical protein
MGLFSSPARFDQQGAQAMACVRLEKQKGPDSLAGIRASMNELQGGRYALALPGWG